MSARTAETVETISPPTLAAPPGTLPEIVAGFAAA